MVHADVFYLVRRGDLRTLENVIKADRHRVLLNSVDRDGNTLLHAACEAQFAEIVEFLLTCKIQVKRLNNAGVPPAHCAVTRGADTETALLIIRILAHSPCDIFTQTATEKDTLMMRAARYNHTRLIHFLVKELRKRHTQPSLAALGADSLTAGSRTTRSDRSSSDPHTSRDSRSRPSRSPSPTGDTIRERKRLRKKGKLVLPAYTVQQYLDLRNHRGETALLLGVGNCCLSAVNALLSVEADVNVRDYRQRYPYDLAVSWPRGTQTAALRKRLKPTPLDTSVPLLVFTPAGATTEVQLPPPELPAVEAVSSVSPTRSYKSQRRGGTLSPPTELMLEFARNELAGLREKQAEREAAMRALAPLQRVEFEEEAEGDEEEEEEEGDGEEEGDLAPYHRVLHLLDCGSLELRTAMDGVQGALGSTAEDLQDMGCVLPQLSVSENDENRQSILAQRPLRRMRYRLTKLEVTDQAAEGRDSEDDTAALSSLLLLALFTAAVYGISVIWAAYNLWGDLPVLV